jgi:EAL domain-containing protein (putative c-di-GMP-specific phosphodiesterase class I)
VSVNLSARQLKDPDFLETVFGVLHDRGVESLQLGLEITESVLMEDADHPVEALEALRAAGALLILDDFGTGYSSLRYLKRFPLDILKVDRSFVHGLGKGAEDPKLVAAMFEMARALGMAVIAEGVETADQLRYLREMGCDFAQGYHFARPLPVPAVTEHLRRNLSGRGAGGKQVLPAGSGVSPPSRAKRLGAARS